MTSQQIPSPRVGKADAHEQSVRRLADLVLGAAALADRLEGAADADAGPDGTQAERVAQLRDFATWASGAIDRAVTDDDWAERFSGQS